MCNQSNPTDLGHLVEQMEADDGKDEDDGEGHDNERVTSLTIRSRVNHDTSLHSKPWRVVCRVQSHHGAGAAAWGPRQNAVPREMVGNGPWPAARVEFGRSACTALRLTPRASASAVNVLGLGTLWCQKQLWVQQRKAWKAGWNRRQTTQGISGRCWEWLPGSP
jgi:hypothetical protein